MSMGAEIDEFLAQLDEISTDSTSVDHYQLQKQKSRNKELRSHLVTVRDFGKEILCLYKNERQERANIQEKLNKAQKEFNELQRSYDDLERRNVNETFNYTQSVSELKEKQAQEHEDYIELSQDYFELLSESTCFLNYELKQPQNKIISKTERFLRNALGENFKNLPKVMRSKRARVGDSVVSRTSSRTSKRGSDKVKDGAEPKRMKTEIWDMKSISQASSPAAAIQFDEETSDLSSEIGEAESSFSFNTFSIGNETSFTLLQGDKNSPSPTRINHRCNCHLYADSDIVLVSTGTNTDPPFEPPVSVTRLLESEDVEENLTNDPVIENIGENENDLKRLFDDLMFKSFIDSLEATTELNVLEVSSTSKNESKDNGKKAESISSHDFDAQFNILENHQLSGKSIVPAFSSTATNTEPEVSKPIKETVEQGTSPELTLTCNKSTATVRSTTTRGTTTVNVTTKSCGSQFPEITMEKIFSETIFELPDCLSPIYEIQVEEVAKTAVGTITELRNVNREVDYIVSTTRVKTELSIEKLVDLHDPEDQSFIILGQTLFDLFLKRIRKSNDCLSDDEITRQKIWKHLKRQLLDRFSELTFDESLNVSFSDSELHERIAVDDLNNKGSKDLYESCTITTDEPANDEADSVEESEELMSIDSTVNQPDELLESTATFVKPAAVTLSKPEIISPSILPDDEQTLIYEEFEHILASMKAICSTPPHLLEPIQDLPDVIFGSLFPDSINEAEEEVEEDCCKSSDDVLAGFDIEYDPIEIPIDNEDEIVQSSCPVFTDFDTPRSPPPFTMTSEIDDPPVIPTEESKKKKCLAKNVDSILDYNPKIRLNILQWQKRHTITNKESDKLLCKIRKSIATYLIAEWTDENLDICVTSIDPFNEFVLTEAIYETVEDNKWQKDVNTDFTPGAPPLPHYQQKLILLIKKLSDKNSLLPHKLIESLEEKLLRLDNSKVELDDLRNISYYYTSLVDLFFGGDLTMVFYFIVKCIYFYGYKAIPMVFVLIKAFPNALPKKSQLLKKYSKGIDWENMTGLELSKVHLDLDWMDSLDLTVMYVLTCIQQYRTKHESKAIKNHELFSYVPKFYGFPLSFISAQKLLDVLLKRLEDGKLENLSLSFILLAKRTNMEFAVKTSLKGRLMPLLNKYVAEVTNCTTSNVTPLQISRVCILIETISSILKTFSEEKEKSFKEVFPMILGVLGRVQNQQIQESCIKAILRLQRFIDNQNEVFEIICHHHDTYSARMSDSLRYAIITFIHRKKKNFFKKPAKMHV